MPPFQIRIVALADEPIACSMDCEEVPWLFGIGLQFLAQTYQVRIHRPGGWVILVSPNLFQKTIASQRLARMADEILQQFEFLGGNLKSLA